MEMLKAGNLGLAFLLELCILAALGYWGFQAGGSALAKIGLGVGAPLVAAILWGVFEAPRSSMRLHGLPGLIVEVAIFGAAIVALYAAGRHSLAWAFALIAVVNRVLIHVWGQ